MLVWDLIDNGGKSNIRELISKIIHDIASPLNTIMMVLDSDDSSMISYANESAIKMAALLNVFRFFFKESEEKVTVVEIERLIKKIGDFSITSQVQYIDLWRVQLMLCIAYTIFCYASKNARVECFVDMQKTLLRVYASNLYCDFIGDNVSVQSKSLAGIASKLADANGVTIKQRELAGCFEIEL